MQQQATPPFASTRVQKQRALAELLGPAGLAAMQARGVDLSAPVQRDADDGPQDDAVQWQRNRLLQRLRDSGLLSDLQKQKTAHSDGAAGMHNATLQSVRPCPDPVAEVPIMDLTLRIANLIDPSGLADEHPAVIAHILRDQDRALRVAVLRTLPGHRSRAVMRYLKRS